MANKIPLSDWNLLLKHALIWKLYVETWMLRRPQKTHIISATVSTTDGWTTIRCAPADRRRKRNGRVRGVDGNPKRGAVENYGRDRAHGARLVCSTGCWRYFGGRRPQIFTDDDEANNNLTITSRDQRKLATTWDSSFTHTYPGMPTTVAMVGQCVQAGRKRIQLQQSIRVRTTKQILSQHEICRNWLEIPTTISLRELDNLEFPDLMGAAYEYLIKRAAIDYRQKAEILRQTKL